MIGAESSDNHTAVAGTGGQRIETTMLQRIRESFAVIDADLTAIRDAVGPGPLAYKIGPI